VNRACAVRSGARSVRVPTQLAAAKVKAQVVDSFDMALAAFKSAVYSC
jgi:hypothetical protein